MPVAGWQIAASLRTVTSAFRNPDMRRLLPSWGAQSFGLWAFAIALGVYGFEAAGPAGVGIAGLVRLLPGALASPVAGLLGDRHPRRLVLLASAVGGTVVLAATAFAVAAGAPTAVVFALAGLFTVATSPYLPAEGALLALVARTPQELSAANVAHSAADNLGFLGGSILTGLLLATTSTAAVIAVAAAAGAISVGLLLGLQRDKRPSYVTSHASSALAETASGARALLADRQLRVVGSVLTVLVFFEGAADVLVVIIALDLLGLGEGAVGYLNAAWGVGALLGGAALAMFVSRARLTAGILIGALLCGLAIALPALWVAALAGYLAWLGIGWGYTFVEVGARTLMQRLGSDESLARALGFLESSRLAAMAVGSLAAPALVAVFGSRWALVAVGGILPIVALARWSVLRHMESGAPVEEVHYRLIRESPIFAPLPVDARERVTRHLIAHEAMSGEDIVVQGEPGEHFFVIESGSVEVYENGVHRRTASVGDCFGEIALLRDSPRTATVRANGRTRLLALERSHFLAAVTTHHRSRQVAADVVSERLGEAPSR